MFIHSAAIDLPMMNTLEPHTLGPLPLEAIYLTFKAGLAAAVGHGRANGYAVIKRGSDPV